MTVGRRANAILRRVAGSFGLSTLEAPTVEQAYRQVRQMDPTLTIVDVSSPSAVRLVQQLARADRPSVVVVTTCAPADDVERVARWAGATCYLPYAELGRLCELLPGDPVGTETGPPRGR